MKQPNDILCARLSGRCALAGQAKLLGLLRGQQTEATQATAFPSKHCVSGSVWLCQDEAAVALWLAKGPMANMLPSPSSRSRAQRTHRSTAARLAKTCLWATCDRAVRPMEASQEGNARSLCQTGNSWKQVPHLSEMKAARPCCPQDLPESSEKSRARTSPTVTVLRACRG